MNDYILSDNYILQKVGEDIVLLPCGNESEVDLTKMIVLNETGGFLISCIEDNYTSFDEILKLFEEKYEGKTDDFRKDISDFLNQMIGKGVVISRK